MRPLYRHLNFQKSQKFQQFWANFGTFFFKISFWSNIGKISQKMVFLRFFSSWRWFLLIFEQFLINSKKYFLKNFKRKIMSITSLHWPHKCGRYGWIANQLVFFIESFDDILFFLFTRCCCYYWAFRLKYISYTYVNFKNLLFSYFFLIWWNKLTKNFRFWICIFIW